MSPSAADDIRIGTILRGTYEIMSLLGTGGMGKVFLARHLRLPSKHVAVKVLLSDEEVTADQYARFRREAEITSRLGHPNIVGVLDFHGTEGEGGAPFLVLEHLSGETLSRRLKKGPIPLPEILFIARQIGSALHAAHQAGVIHRDLKPGNIFLVPTESWDVAAYQVKLLDFGISKLVSSQTLQTQDDVLLGTPRYMSPEQAKGQNSKVDARSDLFALGVIVYEMLSGKSPFADDSVVGIIYRIVNEPVEPLASLCPDLPAPVRAAVERALSKQPGERQPSIAAFIEELTGVSSPSLSPAPVNEVADRGGPSAASVAALPQTVAGRGSRPDASLSAPLPAAVEAPPQSMVVTVPPQAAVEASPPSMMAAPPSLSGSVEPPKSRRPAVIGAALALLVGVGGLVAFWSRGTPPAAAPSVGQESPSRPVAEPPREVATATPPPTSPTEQATPPPAITPPTATEPAPSPPTAQPSPRPAARAEAPEVLPANVREDLAQAERALDANQAAEAILLARRSQRTQLTGAAYSLLTRAHCQQGDLANARAQWPRVPASQRTTVRKYCARHDIEL
jgi:serine/threonine protein kinase